MDQFAQIAAKGIGGNVALLEAVTPAAHTHTDCCLTPASGQPLSVKPHISTADALRKELEAARAQYRPFLENHAPVCADLRRRMEITELLCGGQPVTIPEYGGPIGACKKTYQAVFDLPELEPGRSVYLHFDGAD